MLDWVGANVEALSAGMVAVAGILYGVWQKMSTWKTERAQSRAEVAIAESQKEVFEQLKQRLETQENQVIRLQTDVDKLREELRARETEVHTLKLYVQDLKYILHMHGIDIPQMRV